MWLSIAAKLVPGILKTGMSIASNRGKTKELEYVLSGSCSWSFQYDTGY